MSNKKRQTVVVMAAHADDEVLGCGGVIQKHVANNDKVILCVVTEGWSVKYPNYEAKRKKKELDCRKSADILGISDIIWLNFATLSLAEPSAHVALNEKLEDLFEKINPAIIYTPSDCDINRDHAAVQHSVEVVCRPARPFVNSLKKVLTYEILSSSEWSRTSVFQPNVFVDIEPFLEDKMKALKIYKTEVRPYPHPRSSKGIRILAEYRGLQAGMKAAEAFRLLLSYEY